MGLPVGENVRLPSDVSRGLDGSARLWVITKCPYGIRSENHVACHGGKSRGGGASSRREKPNGHSGRKSLSAPTPPSPRRLRHEDFLRSVHGETRHPRVLRRRRRDVRLLRRKVRVVVEKEKRRWEAAPVELAACAPETGASKTRRRADDSPGGAIESSPTANRNARGPLAVADLAPLPPVSYLPRSIHSANPVVAKHERVAFKANSTKPLCDICQVRSRDHRSKRIVASLARRRARSRPDFPPRAAPRDAFAGATCPRVSRLFTAAGSDRPLGQMGGY